MTPVRNGMIEFVVRNGPHIRTLLTQMKNWLRRPLPESANRITLTGQWCESLGRFELRVCAGSGSLSKKIREVGLAWRVLFNNRSLSGCRTAGPSPYWTPGAENVV